MKNSYEQVVRIICGDDWSSPEKSLDERDGAFGVAIMLAYLQGSNPKLQELARTIDVPPFLLEMAYKRLQMNGLFSPKSWVLDDPILLAFGDNTRDLYGMYQSLRAWCCIAGMASGFTGKGCTREEQSARN